MKPVETNHGHKDIDTEVTQLANAMFGKIKAIKQSHPEISRNVDRMEREIRERIHTIKDNIDKLSKEDRDLVTILIINGLQRTAEEVLTE